MMDLERRGLPAGFVASREFAAAARAQGAALGIEPASVFVTHPIQDRTDDEMAEIARAAFSAVLGLVCQPGDHPDLTVNPAAGAVGRHPDNQPQGD